MSKSSTPIPPPRIGSLQNTRPSPMNIPIPKPRSHRGFVTPPSGDFHPTEYNIMTELPVEMSSKIQKIAFDRDERERQRKYWETPIVGYADAHGRRVGGREVWHVDKSPKDILEEGIRNLSRSNIRKTPSHPWTDADEYYLPRGEFSRPTTPVDQDYFGAIPRHRQIYKNVNIRPLPNDRIQEEHIGIGTEYGVTPWPWEEYYQED